MEASTTISSWLVTAKADLAQQEKQGFANSANWVFRFHFRRSPLQILAKASVEHAIFWRHNLRAASGSTFNCCGKPWLEKNKKHIEQFAKGTLCMICYVTFFWYTTCHSMTHYDISFSDIWYWYVIYEVMYKYMIIISHWYALCSTGIYCRCIFIRIYSFHYPWIY